MCAQQQQHITGLGVSLFNNMMPQHLRNLANDTVDSFKKVLDKFFIQIPDEPHVPGHFHQQSKSNSLIDVIETWNLDRGWALNC